MLAVDTLSGVESLDFEFLGVFLRFWFWLLKTLHLGATTTLFPLL